MEADVSADRPKVEEDEIFMKCKVKDSPGQSEVRRKGAQGRKLPAAAESYSGDNSATSGMDDSRGSGSSGGVRRRKKRKRTVSKAEKSVKLKATQIERALHGRQEPGAVLDDDVSTEDKMSSPSITLNELAISDHGLINDDFRRRAWPRLANLNIYETSVLPTQEEVEGHKSYQQVVLDVSCHFPFFLTSEIIKEKLIRR